MHTSLKNKNKTNKLNHAYHLGVIIDYVNHTIFYLGP